MSDNKIDPTRIPIEQVGRLERKDSERKSGKLIPDQSGSNFDKVLRERTTGLKFSAHAEDRLNRRDIKFSVEELDKLRSAVEKADSKGCKDTLVLVGEKAVVVSIKNKTVITALSGQSVKEGVFTNIDSAVVS